jgi:SAM-dependent methyltransferase
MDRLLELTSQAEESHFWFRGFRQFVTPLLDRAAASRRDLATLDCGCGTGYNLRQLATYGRVVGTDLSATGLAMARRAGRPVVQADATRLPFSSGRFDLVTSFDMLQCIPDDSAALGEMFRVLKRGGHLVGTAAALEMLHGDHSVLSEEVRRYTRGELMKRIRAAGLEPLIVRYAFASLFPMLLAVRVAQRLRGARATGREITLPPAPINDALTALVSSEAALARLISLPLGSSLVFLARKA